MPVSLNPKAFKDQPLCELPIEDALRIGSGKSEGLKPTDFMETSIRFCIDGLHQWLKVYSEEYCDRSLFYIVRDLSWHWASYCETDPLFTKVRKEYVSLRRDIVESSAYVDLVDRLQQGCRIKALGFRGRPFNLLIPAEARGIISRTGEAFGIGFSSFFQIGLGWSLSTNSRSLYTEWIDEVFNPLFAEIQDVANKRKSAVKEIRDTFEQRIVDKLSNESAG